MTQRGKSALWGELLAATELDGISVSALMQRLGIEREAIQLALDEWEAQGRVARRPEGLYVVVMGWRSAAHGSGTYARVKSDQKKTG